LSKTHLNWNAYCAIAEHSPMSDTALTIACHFIDFSSKLSTLITQCSLLITALMPRTLMFVFYSPIY